MSNRCSICNRQDCQEITEEIIKGIPYRQLAEKYGTSLASINRHKAHTKIQTTNAPVQTIDVSDASAVVARIAELDRRADFIYQQSVKKEDRLNAVRALRELRSIVELYAKLTGELSTQTQIVHQHLHINASPEWITLRQRMLSALAPYPEARNALIVAIGEMDNAEE